MNPEVNRDGAQRDGVNHTVVLGCFHTSCQIWLNFMVEANHVSGTMAKIFILASKCSWSFPDRSVSMFLSFASILLQVLFLMLSQRGQCRKKCSDVCVADPHEHTGSSKRRLNKSLSKLLIASQTLLWLTCHFL